MAKRITYKSAGVDIDLKEALIPMIRRIARPTIGAHVLSGVGGFGAIIGLDGTRRMRKPMLVAGTDGVGTKLRIAFMTGRHDTVGIDCVAMCVNDIVCHAARPLFFLDYIAAGKLEARIALDIVKGVARGCRDAGASLVGGETAQMPGFYKAGEYDLVGFAVGVADGERMPNPARMRAGDVIIGLASSGLHSNGFSLARKVLIAKAQLGLEARIDELGCTLGEELLRPTRIYAQAANALFEKFTIKGLANITGGGMPENIPRVMPKGLRAMIRRGSWPVPPVFRMIERIGKIERGEMDRTFNNGIGMAVIVAPVDADAVIAAMRRMRQRAFVIGEVVRGERGVEIN